MPGTGQAAWLLCTGNLLAPQEPIHFLPNPSNVVVIHLSTIFQGDCMRNIGVVYSEYIVHLGPLGDSIGNEASDFHFYMQCNLKIMVQSDSPGDNRAKSSMQSYIGMQVFGKRWKDAAGRQMLD
ncbi:hypothetical protein glysoja_044071 [Glycine soja]|uniref:Uncharacterized protein n=1 Tax=Glycine soja TaxID=3848 RepID=A0A0B2PU10_GLYSO|nr:hypothetical protein glysoja_044071 [Glycine soja]